MILICGKFGADVIVDSIFQKLGLQLVLNTVVLLFDLLGSKL